jgi:uncharacterized membrane protein YgcG
VWASPALALAAEVVNPRRRGAHVADMAGLFGKQVHSLEALAAYLRRAGRAEVVVVSVGNSGALGARELAAQLLTQFALSGSRERGALLLLVEKPLAVELVAQRQLEARRPSVFF